MLWVRPMVKKSVNNYIEWCSQSTQRLEFGQRHEDIMIISYYDIMICVHHVGNILYYTVLYCIVLYYTLLYYTI